MRKTVEITINERSGPLRFRIREMPATRLESWIMRAFLLLTASGVHIPPGADLAQTWHWFRQQGLHSLHALGHLDYQELRPLLDELLECCHRVLDTQVEQAVTPATADGFIGDVSTLLRLRLEALKLNLDFFDEGSPCGCPNPSNTSDSPDTAM